MATNTQLRPALVVIAATTLVLGIGFPAGFVGAAQLLAPSQANGSLIERDGHVVGSALIGQNFTAPRYFHGRPSATAPTPYNAANSSASNLGPTATSLIDRVRGDVAGRRDVPADAVTSSGSGLDPDISPANAQSQIARIAAARGLPTQQVETLVAQATQAPDLGIFGAAHVNVLKLNLALDALPRLR